MIPAALPSVSVNRDRHLIQSEPRPQPAPEETCTVVGAFCQRCGYQMTGEFCPCCGQRQCTNCGER